LLRAIGGHCGRCRGTPGGQGALRAVGGTPGVAGALRTALGALRTLPEALRTALGHSGPVRSHSGRRRGLPGWCTSLISRSYVAPRATQKALARRQLTEVPVCRPVARGGEPRERGRVLAGGPVVVREANAAAPIRHDRP